MTIKGDSEPKEAKPDENDLSQGDRATKDTPAADDAMQGVRCCRICLEEDNETDMIAPCRCKGTSKWVHRHCLDDWRAYNMEDLAFSQCMECVFHFEFEAVKNENERYHQKMRKILYWLLVSRDIILTTFVVQAFILFFAIIFWAFSRNAEGVVEWTDDEFNPVCRTSGCQFWSCYAVGLLALFLAMGIYGSVLLCANDCSFHQAVTAGGGRTRGSRNRGVTGSHSNSLALADCCGGGCDGGGEGGAAILVCLALVGAVLVFVGFVLAAIVSVVVVQLIVRRHLWILQKKHLVKDFRVRDLSDDPEAAGHSQRVIPGIETDRLLRLGLIKRHDSN